MLFSDRSIWTMIHGIVLGGAALVGLFTALFSLWTLPASPPGPGPSRPSPRLDGLLFVTAASLWLTVLAGTYINFPEYRMTPPEGVTDLRQYPRFLIDASPDTAWLHSFGMESKEHMPWIAAMLATAVAFVGARYRSALLTDARLRGMSIAFLGIAFALTSFIALMGTFINKVAPLQ